MTNPYYTTNAAPQGTGATTEEYNISALKDAATERRQVLMEWEVTKERPWVYARSKHQWFNYNLDETTMKEWLQRQLDVRLERLKRRKVEAHEMRNPINTPFYNTSSRKPFVPPTLDSHSINLQRSVGGDQTYIDEREELSHQQMYQEETHQQLGGWNMDEPPTRRMGEERREELLEE